MSDAVMNDYVCIDEMLYARRCMLPRNLPESSMSIVRSTLFSTLLEYKQSTEAPRIDTNNLSVSRKFYIRFRLASPDPI